MLLSFVSEASGFLIYVALLTIGVVGLHRLKSRQSYPVQRSSHYKGYKGFYTRSFETFTDVFLSVSLPSRLTTCPTVPTKFPANVEGQ